MLNRTTKELIEEEIKPRLRTNILNLISELQPMPRGKYLSIICPQCGQRRAYLYVNTLKFKCNRINSCGCSLSLWDYIQKRDHLNTNQEVLFRLADLCGYQTEGAPKKEYPTATVPTILPPNQKNQPFPIWLLNQIAKMAQSNITINVKTFMANRGLDEEMISQMKLGFFSQEMAKQLQSYLIEKKSFNSKAAIYYSRFFENRLLFPHFDQAGRNVKYIAGRTLDWGEEKKWKYKNSPGEKCLYGLTILNQIKQGDPIFICEGQTDLATLRQMKVWNSLGVPGNGFNEDWMETLPKDNIYVLIFDNDKAGEEQRERTGEIFKKHGRKYFNVHLPQQYKDINAFWNEHLYLYDMTIIEYMDSIKQG